VLGGVGVGAGVEEQGDDLGVSPRSGCVEGVDRHLVCRHGGRSGPTAEDQAGGIEVTEEAGQLQWREAVACGGVDQPGLDLEQFGETLDVTHAGGVEHVQVGAGGDKDVDDLGVAAVAGEADGRHAVGITGRGEGRLRADQGSDPIGRSRLDGLEQRVGHRMIVAQVLDRTHVRNYGGGSTPA